MDKWCFNPSMMYCSNFSSSIGSLIIHITTLRTTMFFGRIYISEIHFTFWVNTEYIITNHVLYSIPRLSTFITGAPISDYISSLITLSFLIRRRHCQTPAQIRVDIKSRTSLFRAALQFLLSFPIQLFQMFCRH